MKTSLENLAAKVTQEQDVLLDARTKDEHVSDLAKVRLRAAPKSERRPNARSKTLSKMTAYAALAAAVLLVVAASLFHAKNKPLAFRVGDADGDVGGFVRAPADLPVDLRFSDASNITLEASGRARVVDVDANGARVVLESGVAHVAITHRDASRWHIIAGPFDVVVTGTQFDVAWEPTTEQFSVHMKQGTVHVLGTLLGEGHALSTGEELDVNVPGGVVHQSDTRAPASPTSLDLPVSDMAHLAQDGADDHAQSRADAGSIEAAPLASTIAPASSSAAGSLHAAAVSPAWAQLARRGKYELAIDAAEAAGFDQACDGAKVSDVLALGDAARFTGKNAEAREAYTAVRARSPKDPAAAEAAFDLGRIAFDRDQDYGAAAKWFDSYGRELPNGPLAREAAGRLIEARQKYGDHADLESAAQSYLTKYPDGPHADLARSIVNP
ncbi:MAG: tetratricopeptide repeat protein [Polyangiaceae bacterium]